MSADLFFDADEDFLFREILREPGIIRLPEQRVRSAVRLALENSSYAEKIIFSKIVSVESANIISEKLILKSRLIPKIFVSGSISARMIIFCVTLGLGFDEFISRPQKTDELETFLIDTTGSVYISRAIGAIGEKLSLRASTAGKKISGPLMPGSCGWEIGQGIESIFRAAEPSSIGMTFSTGGMITPNKSAAGVFIEAENLSASKPCAYCPDKSCGYRVTY